MTIGKTNLTKISKDPKFLFYFRKRLEEHCLICNIKVIQAVDKPRGLISILIRLTRFYTPLLFAAPKEGILSNTISYLKGIPEHKETKANLQALNLVGGQKIWKKIVKKVHYLKFVSTESAFLYNGFQSFHDLCSGKLRISQLYFTRYNFCKI